MVVSCPQCDSSYEVADEKLRGRSARMRCPSCQTSWVVSGPESAPRSQAPRSQAPRSQAPRSQAPRSQAPAPWASKAPVDDSDDTAPVSRGVARRREETREKKDLFATPRPEAHHGSVVESSPRGHFSGERSENSVLFTVADLKAQDARRREKESVLPPPMAAAPAFVAPASDGAIDLLAMCSQGGQVKTRGEPLLMPDAPPSGFAISVRPPPDPRRKMAFAGIAAAGAALLLAVGIGLAVRSGPEAKPEAVAAAAPPPVVALPQAPVAAPDKPAAPAADKPASEAPEAKAPSVGATSPKGKGRAQVASKGAPAGGKVSSTAPRGGAVSSPPPSPPKVAAKKGGADPCGCRGNLQCAMKCGL